MRKLLIGVLFLGVVVTCSGGAWFMILGIRGTTDSARVAEVFRYLWPSLAVGGAIVLLAAVPLQLIWRAGSDEDWTFLASAGAGICLYSLVVRHIAPREWLDKLPSLFVFLVPMIVSVAIAYVVLRPLLKRKTPDQTPGDPPAKLQ